MQHLRDLRVQLQERRNRLYKVRVAEFENELGQLLGFIDGNSYTRALVTQLHATDGIGFDDWVAEISNARQTQLPKSETGRARICYEILLQCLNDPQERAALDWAQHFSYEDKYVGMLRDLVEAVVDPFVHYLHDRIEEASSVLYLLQRFKARVEWFRREDLHADYVADTGHGEKRLDRALREFLFDGGIDFPFSQPDSPTGRADVVASLGSDDPLVLEVKVFDPERGKNKGHIRQGFHQVASYANDYNESVGYLAVFNCSSGLLTLPSGRTSRRVRQASCTTRKRSSSLRLISASRGPPPARQDQRVALTSPWRS